MTPLQSHPYGSWNSESVCLTTAAFCESTIPLWLRSKSF